MTTFRHHMTHHMRSLSIAEDDSSLFVWGDSSFLYSEGRKAGGKISRGKEVWTVSQRITTPVGDWSTPSNLKDKELFFIARNWKAARWFSAQIWDHVTWKSELAQNRLNEESDSRIVQEACEDQNPEALANVTEEHLLLSQLDAQFLSTNRS